MLRLVVEPIRPWVDSKARIRSGLEEVRMLDASAREIVERDPSNLVAWTVGIVSDDWDRPVHSKPVRDLETGGVRFAVGHEHAPEHFEDLVPLWNQFLRWLSMRGKPGWLFLADEIPMPAGGWCELGVAIAKGFFSGVSLELSRTALPGRYFAPFQVNNLIELIALWWPSPMGMIGGVSFTANAPAGVVERVARQGAVSAGDLPYVAQLFSTASTFDELGFAVLTRAESWNSIMKELEALGWINDIPVDFIESLD
jgi:hypothetical protein